MVEERLFLKIAHSCRTPRGSTGPVKESLKQRTLFTNIEKMTRKLTTTQNPASHEKNWEKRSTRLVLRCRMMSNSTSKGSEKRLNDKKLEKRQESASRPTVIVIDFGLKILEESETADRWNCPRNALYEVLWNTFPSWSFADVRRMFTGLVSFTEAFLIFGREWLLKPSKLQGTSKTFFHF